jgi:hypothetical protein
MAAMRRSMRVPRPEPRVVKMDEVRGSRFEVRESAAMREPWVRGQNGADAEGADVAAEDAAEKRRGDAVEHFPAEVAEGEVGDGLVVGRDGGEERGGAGGFGAVGGDGGFRKERRAVEGIEIRRDHHVEAVGHGYEAAGGMAGGGEEDVGAAGGVVGRDEFAGETEFGGKLRCPGLGGDPAVGAAFDGETSFADGFDEAAEAMRRFKENGFDGRARAGEAGEFAGGGEAGDASSDDGDSAHALGSRFEV